ncbi:MAG: protein translocase subunit SecF [Candidatus Paceibacterota bacterium]
MFVVKYRKIFYGISIAIIAASVYSIATYGLKLGIDFTGGTVIETQYLADMPESIDMAMLEAADIRSFKTGTSTYKFISTKTYEEMRPLVITAVAQDKYPYQETQINTVGPTLGAELKTKAGLAIAVVVLAILAFIAFAFREVSRPVSSWKYGVIAMVTLLHDIIVPTGVYVLLSHFYGAEVDTLFVIALLTILGISISDKIVVFDRIRENLKLGNVKKFDDVVGISLKQTFTRSINTSVTVVLALLALYFFGPVTTKFFALTLTVGMVVGTYSSIFVASPLLTVWNRNK